MAKLTGVKTLDMVNGEITKVEYDGDVYVKVDGSVQVGDIVRSKGVRDSEEGNFYLTLNGRWDEPAIMDDVNEHRDNLSRFTYFRKQSATPSTSLDERVTMLEKRVDTLEKGEGKSETITHKGVEYKRVYRKAQPGDIVVPTENNNKFFTNGKAYGPVTEGFEIRDNVGDMLSVYAKCANRTEENVKVYEPVKQAVEPLKVGDYAKVIEGGLWHPLSVGDTVEIIRDENDHQPYFAKRVSDGKTAYFEVKQLVRATDEEVAEAKRKLAEKEVEAKWAKLGRQPNELKKGDIVKIIHYQNGAKEGEFVEVRKVFEETLTYTGGYGANNNAVELIAPVESRVDR